MKKQRGFEVVSKYQNQGINLPYRTTKQAAGYDIESAADMVLPSIWKRNFIKILWQLHHQDQVSETDLKAAKEVLKPYLVPTGLKVYMQDGEMLMIANRSSNPIKRGLWLPNSVGIIDADYYNNDNNEGELFIQMINMGITDYHVKKGERIAQGIFMPILLADGADLKAKQRTGGFGSSDQ